MMVFIIVFFGVAGINTLDVRKETVCVAGEYFDNYVMKFTYDLLARPEGCTTTETGVISFIKN